MTRAEQAAGMFHAGASITEVCAAMNLARGTAHYYRRACGMAPGRMKPLKRARVLALLAEGKSISETARILGCSNGCVSGHRSLAGLPPMRQHNAIRLPNLGRCACGLLLPCTCEGSPRRAESYLGRRGEPNYGSAGL